MRGAPKGGRVWLIKNMQTHREGETHTHGQALREAKNESKAKHVQVRL